MAKHYYKIIPQRDYFVPKKHSIECFFIFRIFLYTYLIVYHLFVSRQEMNGIGIKKIDCHHDNQSP